MVRFGISQVIITRIVAFGLLSLMFATNSFAVEINDNLISAIIEVESGGRGDNVMQIQPIVLEEYNNWTSGDIVPIPNIRLDEPRISEFLGRWYLIRLRDHYGCDTLDELLACYNGGPKMRHIKNYSREIKRYIKKVKKELKKGR